MQELGNSLFVEYTLFIVGFIILLKGGDFLVDGATSIAKRLKVSGLVVGLTIVSFGTSMPELMVNLMAGSESDGAGIAIGNIIGSNISNTLLVLGVSAIIFALPMQRSTIVSELPYSLMAVALVGFLANSSLFGISTSGILSTLDGIVLLVFFVLFLIYIYSISKNSSDEADIELEGIPVYSYGKSLSMVILGILGLWIGGEWVVHGAINFADEFGYSKNFIGLTVVAVGTSLPELVTSAVAASRRQTDIAIGNVVGSNIFNMLWILGVGAIVNPLPLQSGSNEDFFVVVVSSFLLILTIVFSKKMLITRYHGAFLVLCYGGYIYYLFQRH